MQTLAIGTRVKNTGWPFVAGNGGYGDLGTVTETTEKRVTVRWDFGAKSNEAKGDVSPVAA